MKTKSGKRGPVLNLVASIPMHEDSDDADGSELGMRRGFGDEDPLLKAVGSVDLESRYEMAHFTQDSQSSQLDVRDEGRPGRAPPGKQKKIFEFAESLEQEKDVEDDEFYRTLNQIYVYFNRKKKMSTILMAIHQCGGDVRDAVMLLARQKGVAEPPVSFSCHNIAAPRDVVERYFRV